MAWKRRYPPMLRCAIERLCWQGEMGADGMGARGERIKMQQGDATCIDGDEWDVDDLPAGDEVWLIGLIGKARTFIDVVLGVQHVMHT